MGKMLTQSGLTEVNVVLVPVGAGVCATPRQGMGRHEAGTQLFQRHREEICAIRPA
jgi:hypothetical protein